MKQGRTRDAITSLSMACVQTCQLNGPFTRRLRAVMCL